MSNCEKILFLILLLNLFLNVNGDNLISVETISGSSTTDEVIREINYLNYVSNDSIDNNYHFYEGTDYSVFQLNINLTNALFNDETTYAKDNFMIEWGIVENGNFYSIQRSNFSSLVDSNFPLSIPNIALYSSSHWGNSYSFALRLSKTINNLTHDGYIVYNGWNAYLGENYTSNFDLRDIFDSQGNLKSGVTLVNINSTYEKTTERWGGYDWDNSGDYYEYTNLSEELVFNLMHSNLIKIYQNLMLESNQGSENFDNISLGSVISTPNFPDVGDVVSLYAYPSEGITFDKWEGSLIYPNEDIDGDGRLDEGMEDIDGDGYFDIGEITDLNGDGILSNHEDVNGDGNQDLGEDRNGDGILNSGEDINLNGLLDKTEDLNGNGIADFGDVDFDMDGRLDLFYENFDNDGNFDNINEDTDGDGNFDTIFEDLNGNGIIDSSNERDNPILLGTVNNFVEITAVFKLDVTDGDNDGLEKWVEVFKSFTSPYNPDSNYDGLNDFIHYENNLDNNTNYSSLLQSLAGDDQFKLDHGLLNINEVKDLRPGSTMIEVSGNQATIQLQMEESSDLQTWEDAGTPATMTIPADTDTKFFRFKMGRDIITAVPEDGLDEVIEDPQLIVFSNTVTNGESFSDVNLEFRNYQEAPVSLNSLDIDNCTILFNGLWSEYRGKFKNSNLTIGDGVSLYGDLTNSTISIIGDEVSTYVDGFGDNVSVYLSSAFGSATFNLTNSNVSAYIYGNYFSGTYQNSTVELEFATDLDGGYILDYNGVNATFINSIISGDFAGVKIEGEFRNSNLSRITNGNLADWSGAILTNTTLPSNVDPVLIESQGAIINSN